MAVPAIRAGILLTASTAAVTAALYENHEPFREWADDVRGRAEAAWIGFKADMKELHEDLQGRSRRREAPWGANAGQWEGLGGRDVEIQGPWRRRRRMSHRRSGSENRGDREQALGTATGVQNGEGEVRKRRGSVHAGQLDNEKMAEAAVDVEAVLDREETRSRASTDTMRSAHEDALSSEAPLTPTTNTSDRMDLDSEDSVSVISAPSEMAEYTPADSVVMTPRSESGGATPSGVLTPTSSSADELIDLDELRRRAEESEDGRSETAGRDDDVVSVASEGMEDARSEISGVSEWSRVSGEAA